VTKLKLSKRQMYGKAGFALLRQRVLHALCLRASLDWRLLRLLIRGRIAGVVSCSRLVRPATQSTLSSLLRGHRLLVRGGKQPSLSFHT
jgi:hypothetical protein